MASDKFRSVNIYFPPEDIELYEWVKKEGRGNESYKGREAFECLRTLQSISSDWREWVERATNAINLLEQVMPGLTDETLAKAIAERMNNDHP